MNNGAEPPVRVLLCVRGFPLLAGLAALLGAEPGIVVTAESTDARDTSSSAAQQTGDVAVLDLTLPRLDAGATVHRLAEHQLGVVVLAGDDHDHRLEAAIRAGARGAVAREGPIRDLTRAIHATAGRRGYLAEALTRRVLDGLTEQVPPAGLAERLAVLTGRERHVLRLVALGMGNDEIASALTVTEATVRSHVYRVLGKLNLRDRAHAVAYVYRNRLMTPPDAD